MLGHMCPVRLERRHNPGQGSQSNHPQGGGQQLGASVAHIGDGEVRGRELEQQLQCQILLLGPVTVDGGLAHLGIRRHLVHGLIDRGMIVEIDHLSYNTLQATLEVLEEREYSGFISSHGWLEHKPSIIRRIMQLGGLVAPMNSRPSKIADGILEYEGLMEEFSFPVGMAIGTDIQGVTSQTEADPHSRIDYPFTSVDGMVTFTRPQTGNRQYDFVKDGMAHYGLLAEWVESLRQEGEKRDPEVMRSFMNSAEAYLQMWERAAAGAP